jgi:hypothetical protein
MRALACSAVSDQERDAMTVARNCSERLAFVLAGVGAACGKPTSSGPGADTTGGEDTGGGVLSDNPCDTDVQQQLSHLSTSAGDAAQDPSCVDGEGDFLVAPDVGGHAGLDACRPWVPPGQQFSDCPIGEKCMPLDSGVDRVWDSTTCVAVATSPLPLGAACTPPDPAEPESDPCDAGLLCWADSANTGACVEACHVDSLPAEDEEGVANKLLATDPSDVCVFTDFDAVSVALPLCNPVDPAAFCDPTLGCYPVHNGFVCLAASGDPDPGDLGDACAFVNDCSPGLLCKDASELPPGCATSACCTEFCDLQNPTPTCSAPGATCQPWFQPTQAPFHPTTDFRDVGFCGIDPSLAMFVETYDPFEIDNGTSYAGGLLATCKASTGNRFDLASFDRDLEELCDALPLCAGHTNLYVELAGTLVTEAGVSPPPGGPRALGTAEIDVVDGIAAYMDGIEMTVGQGQHTVEFCAFDDLSVELGCMQQDVKVDPPMAAGTHTGGTPTGEIAGQIAPGFVSLSGKTGATQLTGLTNDGQAIVTLPTGFTFPFHGTSYGAIRVQANGGVFFGTSGTALGATNVALPASTAPDLAVLWDDHNPAAGGGVWTYYDATRFIVSWENVPHTAGPAGASTSFQVHLLPSGVFEYHYRDTHYTTTTVSLNGGKSATIGSQRPNDTAWLQVSHNTALWGTGKSRRALRVSADDCIISPLKYDEWVECNDPELELAPEAMIDACERTDGKVWVPAPELPTLCGWPTRYQVVGRLVDGGTSASTMVPLNPPRDIVGAAVTADPGVYRAQWSIMNGPLLVSGPFEQILTVAPNFAVKYGAATSTTYGFVGIAATGTPLNLGADAEATVTAPFQVPFYGGRYTSITIGANGAIRFNAGDVHYNNVTLPSSVSTSPDIALFWDDLNPASAGDVYTKYDAANDRFIISWEAVPHHVNVGAGSFQIHLYVTGRIEFHYADGNFGNTSYNNARSATIGIQDHVAGLTSIHNVLVSHNSGWAVMDGQARAFQPVCDN